jgi:hypothetical protein
VLSEKGGLALIQASPEKLKELAMIPAIKGKFVSHLKKKIVLYLNVDRSN